jgi:hypothetical protein
MGLAARRLVVKTLSFKLMPPSKGLVGPKRCSLWDPVTAMRLG